MNFTIRRTYKEKGTSGKLFYEDKLFCYTIERARTGDHPCIPEGTYKASRYDSPKHGPNTWQLEDVPGRSNIQIHVANWVHQLLGCIALGREPIYGEELGVAHSKETVDRFMKLTEGLDSISVIFEEDACQQS